MFFEIHKDIPREGPGNNESTRRAFHMLTDLTVHPHVLDVGCGPGMQTKELANLTDGTITALDRHAPFLQKLDAWIAENGLTKKIKTVQGDMFDLPFEEQSMDLIWSEGAIYIIGFERGLRGWRKLLKPRGYLVLVVSELTWLKEERPSEIEAFWMENYPGIKSAVANEGIAEHAGYQLINHFTLPEAGWWEYYRPLEQRVEMLREQFPGQVNMLDALDETQREIELYKKYSAYYGYTFYILQRQDRE
ncbi:SAM-dependent methyltransferase [Brevibacillus choshinensis]|uniref:SAM-dependent methyltransferase n=1 Tax=Brevibacillus choshinensis TaxID=54911 RepID=A0ABR5MZZ5_BRECH|nr:class I SAM-dependent methyltransferase [Brevibacillus choshinensis]KQL43825.1 SAM-dependent methyltransferase [Brevibacillus choshinensis]